MASSNAPVRKNANAEKLVRNAIYFDLLLSRLGLAASQGQAIDQTIYQLRKSLFTEYLVNELANQQFKLKRKPYIVSYNFVV